MNNKHLLFLLLILTFFISGCSFIKNDYVKQGDKYFSKADFKTALKYYQKGIDENQKDDKAYAMYCRTKHAIYIDNNNIGLDNIESYCDKALKINSKNADALYTKSKMHYQTRDDKIVIFDMNKILDINPKYGAAYNILGYIFLNNDKNYDLAIENFDKALKYYNSKIKDDKIHLYYGLAKAYQGKEDYKNANKYYKKVANFKLHHNFSSYYSIRAKAKLYIKNPDGAIEDIQKAIEYDNNKIADYYGLLIYIYEIKKDYNTALAISNNAIKKVKNPEIIYYERINVKNHIRIQECIDKKNANCTPTQSTIDDIKIAKKLFKNNNDKNYIKIKENILKNNENIYVYWNNIQVKMYYKMYDSIIDDCEKAQKIEFENPYYYEIEGYAYYKLKQYVKSIENLTKAISYSKHGFAYLYTERGNAYLQLGKNNEAIKDYDKALEYDPDYKYAKFGKFVVKAHNLDKKLSKNMQTYIDEQEKKYSSTKNK